MKASWIRSFRASGQSVNALALGLLLASFANEDGMGIRTSPMTLATMLGGCSVRTLNKHLNSLLADGWVKRAAIQGGDGESLRLSHP